MHRKRSTRRTMALAVALLTFVAPWPSTPGAGAGDQPDPATAGSQRYLEEVFPDVEVTENLLYRQTVDYQGNPIDLRLDLYEPAGDTALERPLVVFMHGGWFAFGSKNGMGSVAATYVRRGFVVAAIDYRLNPDNGWNDFGSIDEAMTDEVFLESVFDADADARGAVKWLRRRAAALRLDPDGIVAAGHSAGAVLSLLLAYLPFDPQVPGAYHWTARVGAALPWSGAIPTGLMQAGEPPLHVSHGTADTTIPYSFGQALCQRAAVVGTTCELLTLDGVGHGLTANRDEIVASEAPFLLTHVLGPLGINTDVSPTLTPTFPDVPATHPFAAEIEWAAAQGLAVGHADGTFRPAATTTRQELVAFHHRQVGSPPVVLPAVATFTDVPATHLFAAEIEWAADMKLVSGHADGTFRPAATTTRQAMAGPACRSTLFGL